MRKKKGWICILCIITAIGLSGCSKTTKSCAMGRYMEDTETLPENCDLIGKLSLNEEQQLVINEVTDENKAVEATRKTDGSYETKELEWVTKEIGKTQGVFDYLYERGEDGNEYLMITYLFEEKYGKAHLFRHKQDGSTEELKIKAFDDYTSFGEYRTYWTPTDMYIDEQGNMLLASYSSIVCYDKDSNELYEIDKVQGNSMTASKTAIYVMNEPINKIETYDRTNGEKLDSVDVSITGYDQDQSSQPKVYLTDEEELCYVDCNGIHRRSKGGDIWETIVDGTLNSLYNSENQILRICMDKAGKFYVLVQDRDWNYVLLSYHYDAEVVTVPSVEISVYSLYRSKEITQAVTDYQKQNTNVKVDYQVAISDTGDENTQVDPGDYIRALNTQLLAGNGPDLLILDGMDEQTMIDKGVLADLTDILEPLVKEGTLYPAVADTYLTNGKRFGVPMRMDIPLLTGTKEGREACSSLDTLADYARTHTGGSLLGTIEVSELSALIYDVYGDEIRGAEGELTKEGVERYLTDLKEVADQSVCYEEDHAPEDKIFYGLYGINEKVARVGINICDSPFVPILANKLLGKDCYEAAKNEFIPELSVGMNSASRQKAEAKEFIQLLLSDDMQSNLNANQELGVNPNYADERFKGEKDDIVDIFSYGYDDVIKTFRLTPPPEEEQQQYCEMLKQLNHPVLIDESMKKVVVENSINYLTGKSTLEEAITAIVEFGQTYSQE